MTVFPFNHQDAIKSTKNVAAQTGVLVDGKHGFLNRPNSISGQSSSIYAPITSTQAPLIAPVLSAATEPPILGYLSPAESAKLEPTPYLGFDHYPNELPEDPKRSQAYVYIRPKAELNYNYGTSKESAQLLLPSLDMQPPRENSRRKIRPIAVASAKPQPIAVEEQERSSYGFSTPKPFEAALKTTADSSGGYYYDPAHDPQADQPPQALPIDVNALEGGLLPPFPPQLQKRKLAVLQTNFDAADNNDVTVTRKGFRYLLPHQYHEEEQISESKKAGSFGYVDPFGIRRVVYYNASPEKGFIHRNRNRYVGLGAQPFDEPQPDKV